MPKINVREIIAFLKVLSVEPFILLFAMSYGFGSISLSQLIQDKLCLDEFAQTRSFCVSMNSGNLTLDEEKMKSMILRQSAQYAMYQSILENIPRIFWS